MLSRCSALQFVGPSHRLMPAAAGAPASCCMLLMHALHMLATNRQVCAALQPLAHCKYSTTH